MLLVWLTFTGAAVLHERDEHVKIDFALNMFSNKVKKILYIISYSAIFIVLIIHVFSSFKLVVFQLGTSTPALRMPMTWFSIALLIGFGLMVLFSIIKLLKIRR